jgi:hypothetical protein
MEMMDLRFDPKEIWLTPQVNTETERVDIMLWHPAWAKLERKQQATVAFLFLDEVLGEYGTHWWIGTVDFGAEKLAGAFPLEELAGYIAGLQEKYAWQKFAPGEGLTLYNTKESGNAPFPRSDILTQLTATPMLFRCYMESAGEFEDPLQGTGADYVYVSIPKAYFPEGKEVALRGQFEDLLDEALKTKAAGRCIGGALGRENAYIDLLLFDGRTSLNIVEQTLLRQKLPAGTMIEYFAREKRGQRIAL